MRTIIAGGRDIHDPAILERAIAACPWKITEVVTGGATGVDQMGSDWARRHGLFQVQHCAWEGQDDVLVKDASALLIVGGAESLLRVAHKAGLRVFVYDKLECFGTLCEPAGWDSIKLEEEDWI